MVLKSTERKTNIKLSDGTILEDMPVYELEETGGDRVLFEDLFKAEELRVAKNNNVSIYNIFELALIYADVKQRRNFIRQKFRFNKMLFYIKQRLDEEFGKDVFIFDEMGSARAGPIPINLGKDIKQLQTDGLIDVYLVKDNKKIPGSKKNWEQIKGKAGASIECALTKSGEKVAKKIWFDLDNEIKQIILDVKMDLFYMDTEALKIKVHSEYPKYKKIYIENDNETFESYLVIKN